ncbi:MAG: 50S ribosomal protein L6 [Oligoflexales bacterium]
MSRIGKKTITLPKGVEVKFEKDVVKVKGPKGALERKVHPFMKIEIASGEVKIVPNVEGERSISAIWGLTRTLVDNMVHGVEKGWTKSLTLVGVGYRAAKQGTGLNLTVGYSHPVIFQPIKGVTVDVEKQTVISVTGPSKEDVGETAARIRAIRPPEPYHGKGIRYTEEKIVTKVGKAAGKK